MSVGECRLHVFDAVYVWQAGDVVKERWRGPAADFLVDLEGGSAAKLPGIELKGGGDGSEAFEGFNEERAGHWGAPRVDLGVCPGCVFEGGY